MDRHLLKKWLHYAEKDAKLPKLDSGLWHPYRQTWATERKGLPLTDVTVARCWRDVGTLLECYQQPTNDVLLPVMIEPKNVRDAAVVGGQRLTRGMTKRVMERVTKNEQQRKSL